MSKTGATSVPDPLRLAFTDRADSAVLANFYEGYDQAFVLPNEKEPVEGFQSCLDLNHEPAYGPLASRYGAYREVVFTAEDRETGMLAGGGNFVVFSHARPSDAPVPPYRTIHLSYVYVRPAFRRRGYLDRLVGMVDGLATEVLPYTTGVPSFVFIEQNDPLKMSAAAYAEDTAQTGLDQVDRIGVWARRGARILDLDYVQPPLSAQHAPDSTLALCVLRPDLGTVEACVVYHHIRAFFAISVLKGANPCGVPVARDQIVMLDQMCRASQSIRLLDPMSWVIGPGRRLGENASRVPLAGGLRAVLSAPSTGSR
ncbi:MAG: hypothetical protein AB7E81_16640 [Hyphomicrobiaceae bacterium]